jgi:hypothetical protein
VKTMADVLVAHQRHNSMSCLCGWAKLGHSHPEHQEAMLSTAGFGPVKAAQAEAFDQGQKSGMRHATRIAAAMRLGRPDLPGPMSPNPYRAATIERNPNA